MGRRIRNGVRLGTCFARLFVLVASMLLKSEYVLTLRENSLYLRTCFELEWRTWPYVLVSYMSTRKLRPGHCSSELLIEWQYSSQRGPS